MESYMSDIIEKIEYIFSDAESGQAVNKRMSRVFVLEFELERFLGQVQKSVAEYLSERGRNSGRGR